MVVVRGNCIHFNIDQIFYEVVLTSIINSNTSNAIAQELIEIDQIDKLINLRGLRIIPLRDNQEELAPACQRLSRIGPSFGLEAGPLVEKFTGLLYITNFQFFDMSDNNNLVKSAYIRKVTLIQDQFVKALQIHLIQNESGARLSDILTCNIFVSLLDILLTFEFLHAFPSYDYFNILLQKTLYIYIYIYKTR
uniref:Uncharacterized protein n=1 Tax=Heterorhabditis bacteriophora TaxID=37862 RepID=A0A1I7WZT2_HETBA